MFDCSPVRARRFGPMALLGCTELVLGNQSPRSLRGGARPCCLRSARAESLEQQYESPLQELKGDPRLLGEIVCGGRKEAIYTHRIGDLDAGNPPAPSRFLKSSRTSNPGDTVALHAVAKKLLLGPP
jgi:hypothetical protein